VRKGCCGTAAHDYFPSLTHSRTVRNRNGYPAHYNLRSAPDLEAQSQTFLLGGVTTSCFHISLQKRHQLATADAPNTDEPCLQRLTSHEQNVQAEPDRCRLHEKTAINISECTRQRVGVQAELLPRVPRSPFSLAFFLQWCPV